MLDLKMLYQRRKELAVMAEHKGFPFDLSKFEYLYTERSQTLHLVEQYRNQRNALSQQYPIIQKSRNTEELETLQNQLQTLNQNLKEAENHLRQIQEELDSLLLLIPNEYAHDTPLGTSELDNSEEFVWGERKPPEDTPLDHITLSEKLKLVDVESGIQIAGSRSYVLTDRGADLEWAIHQLCSDILSRQGFKRQRVPSLVRKEAMESTGYLPLGAQDAYQLEEGKFWLAGTSEVGLMSAFLNRSLSEEELPITHYAISTCFRREAGAHGKDTKGFYRVHEFLKTEQVILCAPELEEQLKWFHRLVDNIKTLMMALEIPFRLVRACTGELGLGQYLKYDCESWMPSRGGYGETHSASCFTDYQTRRLKCKIKDGVWKGKYPFSLNSTLAATPRLLIPFLENHQTNDGQVYIPEALRPYLHHQKYLSPQK